MTTDQLDLCFPSAPAPLQEEAETEMVLNYLLQNPGFHTARVLSAALDLTDRQIRRAANLCEDIVSAPGSPGYCHLDHCPTEKVNHYISTLRSQARQMIARSMRLSKRAHTRIG